MGRDLSQKEYASLAEFRYRLRCFLRFTEGNALQAGLEHQQYQALLALRGRAAGAEATVGFLAQRLLLAHHSAVAMVDRLERKGLVLRRRALPDRRKVLVEVTAKGRRLLRKVATASRAELLSSGSKLTEVLQALR